MADGDAKIRDAGGKFVGGHVCIGGRPPGIVEQGPRKLPRRLNVVNLTKTQLGKIDRRTSLGRQLTRRLKAHADQLGRKPSYREQVLIQRAVHLELICDLYESRMRAVDGVLPPPEYLATVDRLERLCRRLGLRPQGQEIPSLEAWVAASQAQDASEGEELTQDATTQPGNRAESFDDEKRPAAHAEPADAQGGGE